MTTPRIATRDSLAKALHAVQFAVPFMPPEDAADAILALLPELDGDALRRAIARSGGLLDPRLHEVDWNEVAAVLGEQS